MGGGCTKPKQKNSNLEEYNKGMYDFKKIVGKGGFGRVWKVSEKKTRKTFALKMMDKAKIITKKSVNSVMNEKDILSKIYHQYIVNMICAFQDRQNIYLLIDYLDGGDLRYYINRRYSFNENQIKFVIRCIMQGLRYLHENNIIHRDIKPQNIILDQKGYCRITDMGIARYWKMENSHETSGTPGYMAPEVLLRQNHSFCADYFAVGVIAYELVIGKRPFQGRDRKAIRDQMLAREAKIPTSFKGVSKECKYFLMKMIQRQAKKRLGYNGINQIFEHPWLKISRQEQQQFLSKKYSSPIIPLQINYHQSLQQITEPDEVWRQNILLLKRPETQNLFNDYYFSPSMREKQEISQNKDIDESMLNLTSDLNGTRPSTRSSQYQIQDTISFPLSTKRKRLE